MSVFVREQLTSFTLCATAAMPSRLSPRCWVTWRQLTTPSERKWYVCLHLYGLFSQRSLLKWVTIVSVGTEGGHLGREICSRLLLVCGHHSEPNPHCWGLRQWGSVVPRHPDRHQPWRRAGICSQDSLWGKWHQMFTSLSRDLENWFPLSLR